LFKNGSQRKIERNPQRHKKNREINLDEYEEYQQGKKKLGGKDLVELLTNINARQNKLRDPSESTHVLPWSHARFTSAVCCHDPA
jgi:hypothetical protein